MTTLRCTSVGGESNRRDPLGAARGDHRPVSVLVGNYSVGPGTSVVSFLQDRLFVSSEGFDTDGVKGVDTLPLFS